MPNKEVIQKKQAPVVKKETPKPIPTQAQQNTSIKADPKKVKYTYTGKESLSEILGKILPKQFIPTERIAGIFGMVFLAIIFLALVTFPYGSLLSGNADVTVKIGFPLTFMELGVLEEGESPLFILNLLLDLLIYLILAYAIDISINLIMDNPLTKSEAEKKKKPTVFKDKKSTVAEKVTKKVIEEPVKK